LATGTQLEIVKDHPIVDLPLDRINGALEVRTTGLDRRHVALLAETGGRWPPIVFWGDECLVVDGAHRVEAARRLGFTTIPAVSFIGSFDEAFMESVYRNVSHGLPLSLADRKKAAVRVLRSNWDWSDRRIASVCGLSGKTVSALRRNVSSWDPVPDTPVIEEPRRVGLDGKARPHRAGDLQDRIRLALFDHPGASLRAIARITATSPETVRTVRTRLAAQVVQASAPPETSPSSDSSATTDDDPAARPATNVPETFSDSGAQIGPPPSTDHWGRDPALLACDDQGEFARWFASNDVGDDWHRFVWTIPVGRVYPVVDEARRRAAAWSAFASMLEGRTR
jgi:ParB-like chromosome segregation protein Spo0J